MNFLFLTSAAYPLYANGAATQVEHTIDKLKSLGHNIIVVSTNPNVFSTQDEVVELNGIKRYYLALGALATNIEAYLFTDKDYNNPNSEKGLLKILENFEPDIVHAHSMGGLGTNLLPLIKNKFPQSRVFVSMHDYWWVSTFQFMVKPNKDPYMQQVVDKSIEEKQAYVYEDFIYYHNKKTPEEFVQQRDLYLRNVLKIVDKIIGVSKSFTEDLKANLPEFADKIEAIPNGVKPPMQNYKNILDSKNFYKKDLNFVFLSGENGLKGGDLVKHAFAEITKENKNVHLHVFQHKDGLKRWWVRLPRDFRRKFFYKSIELYSKYDINNIDQEMYTFADVLLAPSIVKESYGLGVREAAVRGVPSIATDWGGIRDDFKHEKNALLIKLRNNFDGSLFNDFKTQIRRLINDRDLLKELSYNALNTTIPTIEDNVEKLLKLYKVN